MFCSSRVAAWSHLSCVFSISVKVDGFRLMRSFILFCIYFMFEFKSLLIGLPSESKYIRYSSSTTLGSPSWSRSSLPKFVRSNVSSSRTKSLTSLFIFFNEFLRCFWSSGTLSENYLMFLVYRSSSLSTSRPPLLIILATLSCILSTAVSSSYWSWD